MEWKLIDIAPIDRDLELALIDSKGTHPVAFPCRRLADSGWIDVETNTQVYFNSMRPRTGGIGISTDITTLPEVC
jgi:hypothetical protein